MSTLRQLPLLPLVFLNGRSQKIDLSYRRYGCALHTAPVVVVLHALTGNSAVSGETGWWKAVVGAEKVIDTNRYTVIAFDTPGNGSGPAVLDWENWTTHDVAQLFLQGIAALKIRAVFAVIGGSLGGGIAWEMAFQQPHLFQHLIPIATNWKATDWVIGQVYVQHQLLQNSSQPIMDARAHAMLLYRSPESIDQKFGLQKQSETQYKSESWLAHHGKKLDARFSLSAYLLMNQLLKTIGQTYQWSDLAKLAQHHTLKIHPIGIDSDLFFTAATIRKSGDFLQEHGSQQPYRQLVSIHGHDAFLMEYEQLDKLLAPIFTV
ncbi:alpha/beta fold hydrolase [Flavobacterium sp. JP2137]|uniref:alpha/beta fold hydrolase n=1 Tax=Flavobacterium sp. JP2137 TaxID=3414510 RepID=UPI003D300048